MISAARTDDVNRDECVQGSKRIATVSSIDRKSIKIKDCATGNKF